MKVLFVDDEPAILEQAKIFLEGEEESLDVETAVSAKEGLETLEEEDYDAIVSDYQMPGKNGLEFLEVVREERGSDIPFTIFTGKGREEVAMEALNLGADRYLQKGGDPRSQYGVLADAIIREIDHHKDEIEKERARKEWRRTFDALPDIAALISPDHEILRVNQRGAEALGMDREDIVGEKCYEVVHDQDAPIEECPCEKVIETGEADLGEIFEENGRSYIAAASPMLDENGEVEAFAHTVKDITERRETEEELRQYRRAVESSTDPMAAIDDNYRFLFANEAYRNTFLSGTDRLRDLHVEEILGKRTFENHVKPRVDRCLEGENVRYEMTRSVSKGEERHFDISYTPLKGEDGEIIGVTGVVKDITGQKKAEEELKQFREGVQASGDSIYMVDKDHRYVFANEEHISRLAEDGRISRKSENEVVGKKYRDIHPKEDSKAFEGNVLKVIETGEPRTVEHEFTDVDRWSSRTYSPVESSKTGEIEAVVVVSEDITERKELERELRESEERFHSIVDHTNDAIIATDEGGRITYWNKGAENIFGYSSDEIVGGEISKIIPDSMLERHAEAFETAATQEGLQFGGETVECAGIRKDGTEIPLEIMHSIWTLDGRVRFTAVMRDVSEKKKAEEREEFLHSLLRHDVRNKAQIVQGYHELMSEHDLPDRVREHLGNASSAVEDSIDLIEKVRTLREIGGEEEIEEVSVKAIINNVVSGRESQASGRGIDIECRGCECRILGGSLLEELFSNLLENSIVHSGCEGIRIGSEKTEDECIIKIEDDGCGIPDEDKDRIFERSFKKGKNAGSGMGLYLVKEIAESYGGSVEVKGSEMGGARFDVRLQRAN